MRERQTKKQTDSQIDRQRYIGRDILGYKQTHRKRKKERCRGGGQTVRYKGERHTRIHRKRERERERKRGQTVSYREERHTRIHRKRKKDREGRAESVTERIDILGFIGRERKRDVEEADSQIQRGEIYSDS
jgi:hypothetical protein